MIEPGFSDTVLDAQAVFRTVLDAMAAPGRVLELPPLLPSGPFMAARAILLALADNVTPVWLDPTADFGPWLRFHTGTRIVADPGAAQFAFAADAEGHPELDALDPGTEAFPDRSGTLLAEVLELTEGGGLRLRGPGIPEQRGLHVRGLVAGFPTQWTANHARFPAGIDLVLTCGSRLAALPRTVTLEAKCMSR